MLYGAGEKHCASHSRGAETNVDATYSKQLRSSRKGRDKIAVLRREKRVQGGGGRSGRRSQRHGKDPGRQVGGLGEAVHEWLLGTSLPRNGFLPQRTSQCK